MKKILCALAMVLMVASCATREKYEAKLDGFIGYPESRLIGQWGVPTKTYDTLTARYVSYLKDGITDKGSNKYCETVFTIINGQVASWAIEGNGCEAD